MQFLSEVDILSDLFSSELLIPILAIWVASFMQSITGFGLAIIATPLLLISYEAKLAVVIMQCISFCSNTTQSIQLYKKVNWQLVWYLAAGTAAGAPIGVLIYDTVSNTTLKLIVSICILIFLIIMHFFHAKIAETHKNSAITGFFCGVLATTTGMSGPPLVMYLAYTKQEPAITRATCVFYFFLTNIMALTGFYLNGEPVIAAAELAFYLLPGLVLGLICGNIAFKHVSPLLFRRLIFAMLLTSCIYTIYSIL